MCKFRKPGGKLFWRFNPELHMMILKIWLFGLTFLNGPKPVYEFADPYNCTVDDFGWDNPETHRK